MFRNAEQEAQTKRHEVNAVKIPYASDDSSYVVYKTSSKVWESLDPDVDEFACCCFDHMTSEMGDVRNLASNGNSTSELLLRHATAFTPSRKLKVVIVGSGFSALIFAHKLQHQYPQFQELLTHKIFESRDDIGGTWLVNRYPGVKCDVPAHVYVCLSHVLQSSGG